MANRSALGMIGMLLGVVTVLAVSASAVTVSRGLHPLTSPPAKTVTSVVH